MCSRDCLSTRMIPRTAVDSSASAALPFSPSLPGRIAEKPRKHRVGSIRLIYCNCRASFLENPMKIHAHKPARHRAFTLIELLIVITIIVVLASLGFIATNKIRDRAKEANAMRSLSQIGIAHMAYASDHHGAINTIGEGDAEQDATLENSFWSRMQPYLFSGIDSTNLPQMESSINSLFQTADARTMIGTPFSGAPISEEAGLPVPIGFNREHEPVGGQFVRMTVFKNPSRIIYAAYGSGFFEPGDGAAYTPMPQGGTPEPGIYYLESRAAIVCFLDGHVEKVNPPMGPNFFGEPEE